MPIEVAVDIACGHPGMLRLLMEVSPGRFELWIGDVVWRGWEWN